MGVFSKMFLVSAALFAASPAVAGDALKFAPPPSWVVAQKLPAAATAQTEAPVKVLLVDEQVRVEPGKVTRHAEMAIKILKPEGLSVGNLSLSWDPGRDTVTVNKVEIRRGDQVIDVLASGQKFTTIRREANLEEAALDGRLTATMQPDDLREGDTIVLATTIEHVDAILGNHVETTFGDWNNLPIALAHSRIQWPVSMPLSLREAGGLDSATPTVRDGFKTVELTSHDVDPVVSPKNAPARFTSGRFGEATDFRSWSDVAAATAPLFRTAEVIPASGTLRDEVNKIRSATSDPKLRAEQALQLVQDRIRYFGLFMGEGGYKPATAEETWARRFGDCKAKTALLLGILHELHIEAEPVLVRASGGGDLVAERLPAMGVFDHVLVRAHIGGKPYWLDGTRSGDASLDDIEIPNFTWGLPLVSNAKLISIVPPPLSRPATETNVSIDATKGVRAPVGFAVEQNVRGDAAVAFGRAVGSLTEAQKTEFFSTYWQRSYDFVTPGPTKVVFDPKARTLTLSMRGDGKIDWNDSFFHIPNSTIGYSPDFKRTPGPMQEVPLAVPYPSYVRSRTTVRFPVHYSTLQQQGPGRTTAETLAGVEYRRTSQFTSDASADVLVVETSERSLTPEIPYKAGIAAMPRLRQLADEDVSVRLPSSYRPTPADLDAMVAETPTTVKARIERARALIRGGKVDEAVADFSEVLKADPKNMDAITGRAFAYAWKRDPAASKDIAAGMAIDPTNASLQEARGFLAQQNYNCPDAIEAFSKALEKDSTNIFALAQRAMCEQAIGKTEQALADSATVLKQAPNHTDMRVLRANILYLNGDRDAANREAEQLIAGNPGESYTLVAAAKIFAATGEKARALQAFDRALAIKPKAYIYVNRAQTRDRSEAAAQMADLDAALKLDPNNVEALAGKAAALDQLGRYKEAVAFYDLAFKQLPNDTGIPVARAISLYRSGQTREGEAALAALAAKARTANELNNLCYPEATARVLLEAALRQCREAVRLKPNDGAIQDSLGMALLQSGKLDEALVAYTKAIELNAGATSLMGRAIIYERKGDRARSEADAAAARKLSPKIDETFAEFGLKL